MTRTKPLGSVAAIVAGTLLLLSPAGAQQAQPQYSRVSITPDDCKNIQVYRPAPGVKYQPGVDAQGRPVAPADLGNRPRIQAPKEITIEITRQLPGMTTGKSPTSGGPAPGGSATSGTSAASKAPGFDSKAYLGYVTVKDGRAYYNGQPLGDPDARAIAEACAAQIPR